MRRAGHLDTRELVAIFLGGSVGALARAALTQALAVRADAWPWATFAANLLAVLVLGLLLAGGAGGAAEPSYRRAFLTTGLCGALSTFSTMMLELLRMIDANDWGLALAYAGASLVGALATFALADRVGRRERLAA